MTPHDANAIRSSPYSGKPPPRALLSRLRRLLRFSLRGVLLFTAAIALLMSVVGVPLGHLRRQQVAVEQLEKRGCRLTSEAARGPTAWAAAKLFGNSAALHVTEVLSTPLTDDAVAVLSRLKRLQWLGVSDTRLSEVACDALAAALPKTTIDD